MSTADLPKLMKAWQYSTATGGIQNHLVLNDSVALPTLSSRLGDAELLVRVLSASINPADYKVPSGRRCACRDPHPAYSGDGFWRPRRAGYAYLFGRIDAQQHGTCAEYVVVPTKACARVPDGVSVDEAAAIGVAGITAYQTISPNVKPGDKVFLNGGSGGTGTFGIQIAKARGCHVTVSCSPAKADLCRSLGADEIIDYTAVDVSQALKAKGQIFALVVDNVGAPENLYKAADDFLLPHGKFVQVGGSVSLSSAKTIASRLLIPSFLGGGKNKYELYTIKHGPEDLKQLGQWVAEKKIKVVVEETFEMEDLPKAFEKLREGRNAGKLVIHIGK
ncbi:Reticulon-4-interacting protein 1, mitochondrial [Madurella mycetomatis]|uniref:Reticulon-4-interacting protein 1, mitochondrial n=1 Tax=Madurella mycetomatis TaxID=100816 RepID=A0A175W969_9PEZI|nr:Reticulon-4-interacting protein 1, mitochondrial [Madurella mycetomatis]